jgi:serine protease Do
MRNVRLVPILAGALTLLVAGLGIPIPADAAWRAPALAPAASAAESSREGEIPPAVVAFADRLSEAFRDAAKRVGPAVVAITTSETVTAPSSPFGGLPDDFLRRFFGQGPEGGGNDEGEGGGPTQKFQRRGLGSGVIVDASGYILTNNHVVSGAQQITVRLADDREFKGKVVGADPPTDVALVKIEAGKLPVAELGDSDKVQVGDWVIAIGAPFGLEHTVTAGIVSATGRHNVGIASYESFIQTDAAINPGNSGGPLVNMRGQVIGMNTAIASQSGGYMGAGFAVPSNMGREVMKQLREKGEVVRGWLGVGIQRLTPDLAESMKLKPDEGVLVSQVFEGGPADRAGLKAGDVVVEFGGKAIKTPTELQNSVAWMAPGAKIDLVVLRAGKRMELKATVEKRSAKAEVAAGRQAGPVEMKDLGIKVSNVTPEAGQRFGYKPGQGVLISGVDPGGLGAQAGLRVGMLILKVGEQAVTNVGELETALGKADLAKGLPMLVRSGENQIFILLKKR